MTLFFISALLFLIASVFFIFNRVNLGSIDAAKRIDVLDSRVDGMFSDFDKMKNDLSIKMDLILQNVEKSGIILDKTRQKVEYLEMKSDAQARNQVSNNKPIQISLVYRKAQAKATAIVEPPPVKTEVLKPGPGVLKSVKKKMSELSQ